MGRFDHINADDLFTPGPSSPPVKQGKPPTRQKRVVSAPTPPDDSLPTAPSEWFFTFFYDENRNLCVAFTPIAYWRANRAQIDVHVTDAIWASLPRYLLGNEEMEATFVMSQMSQLHTEEQVRSDLVERGFQQNPQFDRFMGPNASIRF